MKKRSQPEVTVAAKRLTPEEERRLITAIDLFLAEMVRQQLGRDREEHEVSTSQRKEVHRARPL